jgi:carbon storage regulator
VLVLSRKIGERLIINSNITLIVQRITGNRVVLAIQADKSTRILRGELVERDEGKQGRAA